MDYELPLLLFSLTNTQLARKYFLGLELKFRQISSPPSFFTDCLSKLRFQLQSEMLSNRENHSKDLWKELEAGLGSEAQFRVLLHLVLKPEEAYTKYGLVKAS